MLRSTLTCEGVRVRIVTACGMHVAELECDKISQQVSNRNANYKVEELEFPVTLARDQLLGQKTEAQCCF